MSLICLTHIHAQLARCSGSLSLNAFGVTRYLTCRSESTGEGDFVVFALLNGNQKEELMTT